MHKILIALLFCSTPTLLPAQPIDKKATKETVNLYRNLRLSLNKGILFGHQDDLAYGLNADSSRWQAEPGRSDIKAVTGDYPAVYGWELGGIEQGHQNNLDGVSFDDMRRYIQEGYERGGVITISWHLRNPVTGGSAWDSTGDVVKDIIPGGSYNDTYKAYLDKVGTFLKSLKDKNGTPIPVILRLFHELNGNWFWWGGKNCTPGELKQLWHFTVSYLRDSLQLHHLLYAYNTDRFSSPAAYLERYPGDEWTDITGFDIYQGYDLSRNEAFLHALDTTLTMLENIAAQHHKIPALTEFGYSGLADSTWWTRVFLKGVEHHRIAYALAWRNGGCGPNGKCEFYVPFKGQASARDFIRMYHSGKILFQRAASREKLYRGKE